MHVSDLVEGTGARLICGRPATPVADLCDDSRRATPGCAFIARRGTRDDGRCYVGQAIERGASVVISEPARSRRDFVTAGRELTWATIDRVDQALTGRLAERFFGYPSRKLKLVGVTGTNGKTTTAFLIHHLLRSAGDRCGMLSTVWNDDGRSRYPADMTTPGPIELSRWLSTTAANGCRAAVIEVSSHALDQGRTAALAFDAAVFTNLSGDHLDYHITMDAYASAKARLFEVLTCADRAVVNADDPYVKRILRDCPARVIRCCLGGAINGNWDYSATVSELAADHTDACLEGPCGRVAIRLPLVGRHNLANALLAVAAANAVFGQSKTLWQSLSSCPSVPGRLEPVGSCWPSAGPTVLVDYAHTHAALENALLAVRPLTVGKLVVVFGCGGDRDVTKRPKMASVACRFADWVVITSDNPRTEDPMAIIHDICLGVPDDAAGRMSIEPDRSAAIVAAIEQSGVDDLVLIAGKGHEDYQESGTTKRHFDDREEAAKALGVAARRH